MKKILLVIIPVVLIAGGYLGYARFIKKDSEAGVQKPAAQTEQKGFDKSQRSTDEPGSIWWVVNKKRPLPNNYVPPKLTAPSIELRWAKDAETMQVSEEAVPSLEEMYKASQAAGFKLELISGYRSTAYQKTLYDSHVAQFGQAEADRQSARPGTSEHQTGLAVDLGRTDKKCELEECFGDTPEGKWLAEHAHEYGFIVRYLKDKEQHTGYMYEPWHLRYVGKELANELFSRNLTMEEFFEL